MNFYGTPAWAAPPTDSQSSQTFGFGGSSIDVESFVEANTAPVVHAGLQYGQQMIQQELYKSKQTILPMYDHIRLYFCVDHAYVISKLGLLFFPFIKLKRWATLASPSSPNTSMSSNFSSNDFGGKSSPLPQNAPQELNSFSPAGAAGPTVAVKHNNSSDATTGGPPPGAPRHLLPLYNRLAFDLYIPIMAILTYMVLSAFVKGLTQQGTSGSSDIFWIILRSLGIRLILEGLVLFGFGMLKIGIICAKLSVLDVAALIGYKYVLLSVEVVALLLIGPTSKAVWTATLYTLLAGFFFTARILEGFEVLREEGNTSSISRVHFFTSAFIIILVQTPQVFWAFSNLFPSRRDWAF